MATLKLILDGLIFVGLIFIFIQARKIYKYSKQIEANYKLLVTTNKLKKLINESWKK